MSDTPGFDPTSPLDATLDEHRSIRDCLARVEACLDRRPQAPEAWLSDLSGCLRTLRATLAEHFEAEEAGPLFKAIPAAHPRLATRLKALEDEHPTILEQIDAVLRRGDGLTEPEPFELRELNARAQLVVARVCRHEAAENELVMEAHWDVVGVGD